MFGPRLIPALLGSVAWLLAAASSYAEDQNKVTIYYHTRPPYAFTNSDGKIEGILVTPVDQAFTKIGIAVTWEDVPPNRQLEIIKRNVDPVCGLGWFKRPERESFAHFSLPIYKDQKPVLVARSADARFGDSGLLADFFGNRDLMLIKKVGYSYGPKIDQLIEKTRVNARDSTGSNVDILNMIIKSHGDYIIMAQEEADYLLDEEIDFKGKLKIVSVPDVDEGEERHLMCSLSTPIEIIDKFNPAFVTAVAQP